MIIITHHKDRVVQIENESVSIAGGKGHRLLATVLQVAKDHPDKLIIWVDKRYREVLNLEYFRKTNFTNTLQSFNPGNNFMSKDIGFAEETLFVNVNKNVKYPTWLMSDLVGGARSLVFNTITSTLSITTPFNYYLNAIAKSAMSQGLLCYSNPHLMNTSKTLSASNNKISTPHFFQFIKQHYKKRWLFLVAFQQLIFERRFTFLYAILTLLKSKHTLSYTAFTPTLPTLNKEPTIDVLIPTMGRKEYLLDVLKDLQKQTLQPKRILIVEQNPDLQSSTQLDYLLDKNWPFKIEHTFIHQTGACNARNLALAQVESEWVFFADDDIRLETNTLTDALSLAQKFEMDAITMSCLQKGEKEKIKQPIQWLGFGSGTSLVKSTAINDKKFVMGYEHGHGEDGDFGMQLRATGTDVLYAPNIQLLHLKAPIGGFRKKIIKEWDTGKVMPKPSPTVMLYKIKHLTSTQFKSYKFSFFIKNYQFRELKNPFASLRKMNKSWNTSLRWAKKLEQRHG